MLVYGGGHVAERRYGNYCGAAGKINNNTFFIIVGTCAISITP